MRGGTPGQRGVVSLLVLNGNLQPIWVDILNENVSFVVKKSVGEPHVSGITFLVAMQEHVGVNAKDLVQMRLVHI